MATLQKIRSKGKTIIGIVGLALFAFIAEEFVRSLSYTQTESRQRVGKIDGESVNVQEFNTLVEEYSDAVKFSNGLTTLSDDQLSMMRDQVWQTLVNQKLIEKECKKLGLTVTDAELQDIINTGRNQMLSQTPFRTQQGQFDANALKQFLSQYDEIVNNPEVPSETKDQYVQMHNYWNFIEKSVRQQTLAQKYQSLLSNALISNPVSAKASFDGRNTESDIFMAVLPYTSIKDDEITISDNDLKAKYNELKDMFQSTEETRDIKYIDIAVEASPEDRKALEDEMNGYAQALADGADPAKTVREAASQIPYSLLPVSAKALPHDIEHQLDSLTDGSQKGPFVNEGDNTLNIVRRLATVIRPDSVEYRQLIVPGADMAAVEKTADSIMTALNNGEVFDTIAKKYNQPALKNWLVSAQYEGLTVGEADRHFIETLTTSPVNVYNKIVLNGQGIIIAQVTDRRNMVQKYNLAVIKRAIDFSKETYGKAYNDFSAFLAGNPKAEDIEANAAGAGYTLQTRQALSSTEHNVAGVRSTREAMRWIFNKDTRAGEVSPLYECGENDHLLVVILEGIHKKGYLPWSDEQVKSFLTTEVMKEKKAEILRDKMKDAKSVADVAKISDAVSDTIKHITLSSNTFVSKVASSEPALSGSVSTAKKGDFRTGIKGNGGVYAYQVLEQKTLSDKFDEKQEATTATQQNRRALNSYISELYQKAKIDDKRYIFY